MSGLVDFSKGLLLITGCLRQRSAISVGGTRQASAVDSPFCRDGLRRPTLRGQGIAGALFATLARTGQRAPSALTCGLPGAGAGVDDADTSVLRVWNSHPVPCWHSAGLLPTLQPRQQVALRQDTAAADEGTLFDQEVLSPGHEWPLVMEFDLTAYAQWCAHPRLGETQLAVEQALAQMNAALAEWQRQRQRCWIGRRVARGQGWMELTELQVLRLPDPLSMTWMREALYEVHDGTEHRRAWRAFANFLPTLAQAQAVELPAALPRAPAPEAPWRYRRLLGTCSAGVRDDGWGLDSFTSAGHGADAIGAAYIDQHLVIPADQKPDTFQAAFKPDAGLAMVQRWNATNGQLDPPEPQVQGSGMAGAMRHALSRRDRLAGHRVRDPVTGLDYVSSTTDDLRMESWFGGPPGDERANSSRVLVRDAYLSEASRNDWRMVWSTHHAEDEFRASVYAGALFNRLQLVQATFEWELMVEMPPDGDPDACVAAIRELLASHNGHGLAVGGRTWAGHGRLRWVVTQLQRADAGQDWDDDQESDK